VPTAVAILDNRKLSILFWILAALVFCIVKRDIRASLIGVIKAAMAPRIAVPLAGMIIYIGAIVTALWTAGVWTLDSFADTAFWLAGSGLVLFFVTYDRVRTDPRFFRRTATRTLSVVVIVGFLVDLFPLPLPAELLLVPFLVLLGATLAIASTRADLAPVSRLLNGVVAIIGWALLVYGAARVAADPGSFASVETARAFAIPLLLTLTFLPFVYALAVYANLDSIRAELRWILGDDIALYRYARRRVLLTTGVRLRSVVRAARAPWHLILSQPSSRVEIDRVIAHIKARTSNALAMSLPTEARIQSIVSDQDPGWEYLLFAARLEAGRTALASSMSSVDVTGRALDTPRSRRKAIDRLQRDNRDALALIEDIDRLFDQTAILHAFGAPGEPGSVEHIIDLAEALILKRDSFLKWTSRAQATGASADLAALLATHAELLDQPNHQIEKYIDDWIDLGERLPELLHSAEDATETIEIEMALNISVDDRALDRFTHEIERMGAA
jgi:hypothetical protein